MRCCPTDPRSQCRPAITLVEILAATVLSVLLMSAIVGVLQGLHRQRVATLPQETSPAWMARLEKRLEWDFLNARQMHVRPGRLTLVGYGSRNFSSGIVVHLPCEVVYRIDHSDGQYWLIREERQFDLATNRNLRSEVLCSGIGGIYAGRMEESSADLLRKRIAFDNLYSVPGKLRFVLTAEDGAILLESTVMADAGLP